MKDRRAALGLLVTLIGLERAAYYAAKSLFAHDLPGGLAPLARFAPLAPLALLAGGALALVLGARRTLVAGAALAAAAYAVVGHAPASALGVVLGAVLLGHWILRPSLYALAGELVGEARVNVRSAVFVASAAALQVGSFLGPIFGGTLRVVIHGPVFGASAAALAAIAIVGVGLARAEPPAPELPAARPAALLGLTAAFVPLWLGSALAGRLQFDDTVQGARAGLIALVFEIGAPLLLVAALILLEVARASLPPLLPIGVALAVFALGVVLAASGAGELALPSVVLTSFGETAAGPFALALVAVSAPRRLAPLWVAGWVAAPGLFAALAALSPGPPGAGVLLGLALLCAAGGAAALRFQRELGALFAPAPAT